MSGQVFVVTVAGVMARVLRSEFEDFEVLVGNGVTRLRFVSADPAVLHGLLHRIEALGLELLDVHSSNDDVHSSDEAQLQ